LTLALPARAKLNLDLSVVSKREDGFHELRTTFQAIDLHDLVVIEPANESALTISGLSVGKNDNSVIKAQQALEDAARRKLPADIHLHKRIPPGSGMGGASSDAATTLRALKTIYALDVDLRPIATELGADVTFFLHGGHARAEGRGERLTLLPVDPAWFAIAWPGFELSTAAVYGAWDEVKGEGPNHLRRAAERVEPRLTHFANKLGDGWQMTGSGSAFFKRCGNEQEARRAVKGLDGWTAVTSSIEPWA
jgi:4-diphosphocytidyl-2-C-methyl-D-erythritol kinase